MSKPRNQEYSIGKWSIQFWANIHMYCHRLVASKGKKTYELHCEDLPIKGPFVGVWLYETEMPDLHRDELITVLAKWGDKTEKRLKIYTEREVSHLNLGDGTIRIEKTSPTGESLEKS
ncbi:hypothetical protein [Adhaeretor mobilis]|uniref:Uncharacterized protein n=1 Tax=Adhaeretor mobilis TaxID=1930276 RepID=A0A517MVW9_9BACT|nr:hypothetical protein [Adhaeretor mobilis]QDS99024.1 hypothetical protein HG15A2_23130 [Adhaeretor mobilis]